MKASDAPKVMGMTHFFSCFVYHIETNLYWTIM